ncbi:AAA family ATPase [Pedobacter antarcticus]
MAEEIRARIKQYSILAVTGPRQSGKTTLLKTLFPDYEYLSLEKNRYQHLNYYFWQDYNGLEIDLLLKNANAFDVYEVKSTRTLGSALFKNLR